MSYFRTTIFVAVICAFVSGVSLGADLAPGNVIFPGGTTVGLRPELAGVVQNDNLIDFRMDPFPATPLTDVGGNVQNRVVESNDLGTMVFAPRIRDTFNIDSGRFEIVSFQLHGFAGWDTDVDYRTDGLGDVGPTSVSRSADGDMLTFRYDDPMSIDAIGPGLQEESYFPSILTDATDYELTGRMTIFGHDSQFPNDLISVSLSGLAVPVPEPASYGMCGMGLLFALLRLRRRF